MSRFPLLLAAAALTVARAASAQRRAVDVLIRGGMVVDGSGGGPRVADVGLKGQRIAFIGNAASARIVAGKTIDARGLYVAPGFIDPHTHTFDDLGSPARRANVPYLMQGVTTVITGNDGGGPIEIASALDRWQKQGIGTNAALLVGQGTVRRRVLGMSDAKPTPVQLDSMRALVARAMSEGALGMSTGLYYAPGSYASTEEVIELAKVAASAGGIYDSHLRDESSYTVGLIGAVSEALRIGREARIPIHISHIKALGADVWGKSREVIALIQAARKEGLDVTADQYPYTASGSSVGASLLPRWAEVGGRDSLRARIDDPAIHARLASDMKENLRRRGGAESLLITSSRDSTILGKTLAAVAATRQVEPVEAAMSIIHEGDAGVASFNMKDSDIDAFMVQDFVSTGSDGSEGHPRKYGTFPKKLHEYVFTRKLITLPFAIRASAARTAEAFHLVERGQLREGWFADVIVFDEKKLADRATYREPELLAAGMRYVFVNGAAAVVAGTYTGALAGVPLRRPGSAGEKPR
ncbi:MAG: amidohydrolase family protein [Gemmatimonadota bacterium]|nr:amidohydrolase family protein [Gemmatimonadota bacterium]